MLNKSIPRPRGYDYPSPTIESGQTQAATHVTPKPLSPENVQKLRDSVRNQPIVKPKGGC